MNENIKNGDGNLEALRRYEREIDKRDIAWEGSLERIDNIYGNTLDEILAYIKQEADETGFEFRDLWEAFLDNYL